MPEATMHEDDGTVLLKDNIWSPINFGGMDSEAKTPDMQRSPELDLRLLWRQAIGCGR
jgi:hypothetical protein